MKYFMVELLKNNVLAITLYFLKSARNYLVVRFFSLVPNGPAPGPGVKNDPVDHFSAGGGGGWTC